MNKLTGYILALAGLIILALSIANLLVIPGINPSYLIFAGIILIAVGVFLTLGQSEKQLEEVPIYEGDGKHRKVVAYKRMKK